MYVALDSNILLQDPWLESRRVSALFDFAGTTRGKVLIHEVVMTETKAELRRRWTRIGTDFLSLQRQARRLRMPIPMAGDLEQSVDAVGLQWEEHCRSFNRYLWRDIPTDPELIGELVHRAAYRIPPCSSSGEEMRDALLWLGVLRHCRDQGWKDVAFISANKRDFADSNGNLLERLREDVLAYELDLRFYTSLDDFLKDQADPIAHITVEWVNERVSETEVAEFIEAALEEQDWEELLPWSERGEGWDPYSGPEIEGLSASLEDVYVWRHSDEGVEVFLDYFVQLQGRVDCEREVGDPERGYWTEQRAFSKDLERVAHVSAFVVGDEVQLSEVDRVGRT